MIPDTMIAKAADKLIDKPFYLGDLSGKNGFDCLNSLKSFYDDIGVSFPTEFEDYNQNNYAEKWEDDPDKSRDIFIRFLMGLGEKVENVNFCIRGDLLILEAGVEKKSVPKEKIISVLKSVEKKFPFMVKETRKILQGKKLLTFPAIYLGNGHILIVVTTDKDNRGARVVPLKFFKRFIKEIRRLG